MFSAILPFGQLAVGRFASFWLTIIHQALRSSCWQMQPGKREDMLGQVHGFVGPVFLTCYNGGKEKFNQHVLNLRMT